MTLPKLPPIGQIRKWLITAAGLLSSLLALGLLPSPYEGWVSTALAVVTLAVHYVVPNDQPAAVIAPADAAHLAAAKADLATLNAKITGIGSAIAAALQPPPASQPPTDDQIKP